MAELTGADFHAAADQTDDAADHDELHAAGAVMDGDSIWAYSDPYVRRWIDGLRTRFNIGGDW